MGSISFGRVMDYLTGKWWFYVLLLLIGFFLLPPYASKGYTSSAEIPMVVLEGLRNAIINTLVRLFWPALIIHVVFLVAVLLIVLRHRLATTVFNVLCAVLYLMIAIGQSVGTSERYGLVIMVGNQVLILLVAISWIWECIARRNNFTGNVNRDLLWLVPFAILAFWSPPEPRPDITYLLKYLIAGYFGVAYCLTTPVVLTIMLLHYPRVNVSVLRLTAFLGLCFAVINVLSPIWVPRALMYRAIWGGVVLHVPLLATSITALLTSRKVAS